MPALSTRSSSGLGTTPAFERTFSTLLIALCVGLSFAATIANAQPSVAARTQIEESIRAREYQLTWHEAAYLEGVNSAWQAPNRAHGFLTYFTDTGISLVHRSSNDERNWHAGLSLIGFGRGTRVATVESPSLAPDVQRIEFLRDRIVEWYVNDSNGLEQGFVLSAPPEEQARATQPVPGVRRKASTEAAYLVLKLEGSLAAKISADGQAVDLLPRSGGLAVLHYGKLEVRDATGRRLTSWIEGFAEAGIRGLRLVFEDEGAVYPVTVDPLVSHAAWTGETDNPGASYGFSVATAGDVNDDGYDDIVVGAPYFWGSARDTGRVFVYHGSASGLETDPAWTAEGVLEDGQFGYSVGTAGDVNDDGFDDVIVGSPQFSNGEFWEGAAFVFYGSDTGLLSCGESPCTPAAAAWSVEADQAQATLGRSVATAGKVNGDEYDDVIVGAPGFGNDQAAEGAAFVYHGSSAGPATSPSWTGESDESYSFFGVSVATAGDVNDDGYDDVIVGADEYGFGGAVPFAGAVFVYRGSATGLDSSSVWVAGGDKENDRIGFSVAGTGDVNGDGRADVAIGARYYDLGDGESGAVFVFHGPLEFAACGDVGQGESECRPADADWFGTGDTGLEQFGYSVGAAGDVNGDGYDDLIVGAPNFNDPATNEGRAYVYEGSVSGLPPSPAWAWATESNRDTAMLGWSVATAGDVNGDGFHDVIAGAHTSRPGGQAFAYHGAARVTAWSLATHLGLLPSSIQQVTWGVTTGDETEPLLNIETPEAVSFGPVPQSLFLTTGRVTDKKAEWSYPQAYTGITDVDWGADGLPDTATLELQLNVPPWAKTLRFTTQYVTNEIGAEHGDPFDTDTAHLRFYLNGWSAEEYPLDEPAQWVVNPPASHAINVAGAGQTRIVFTVEDTDADDTEGDTEDSGLVVSRLFFSALPFPSDITLDSDGVDGNGDGIVDYFANPSPHDVSISSGTYSLSRELLSIPGTSLPFRFSIVYNSRSDRLGTLGRKWTHSYGGQVEKILTDEDADGTPETLSLVLVRHGSGTAEYFEPVDPLDLSAGYVPKHPGTTSKLSEGPSGFTLVTKRHSTYEFLEPGDTTEVVLLSRVTDSNGNSFELDYGMVGDSKKIVDVVDTRGEQIDFIYSNGRLTALEYDWISNDDPPVPITSLIRLAYDLSTNDLVSYTDLNGLVTTFTYDEVGNLLTVTDPDGTTSVANSFEQYQGIDLMQVGERVVSQRDARDPDVLDSEAGLAYEYEGEALRLTDRLGNEDTRMFDVKGRMVRRVDPSGVLWEYGFDRDGNIIESRRKLPSEDIPRIVYVATYDDMGRQLSRTDFPGICVGGINSDDSCTADTDCPGSSCGVYRSMSFDPYGNPGSTSDHYGNTTTFFYDSAHNLTGQTDALGNTVFHGHTDSGQFASTTDHRGQVCAAVYDLALPEPTRVYNPVDADDDGTLDFVAYERDALGRWTAMIDPRGYRTAFEFDDGGRLIKETDPIGNSTEHDYDSAGHLLAVHLPNGAVDRFVYTLTGKIAQGIDALGNTTSYHYDEEDRVRSVEDPLGRLTRYDYDAAGRLTFVETCDAEAADCIGVSGAYDEVGNLVEINQIIDAGTQRTTSFEYDLLGRLVHEVNALGEATSYGYDARGLATSVVNARGQALDHEYDALGRLTRTEFAGGSVTHTLDASGNSTLSVSNRYAGVHRDFDLMDRLITRTDTFGNTTAYGYDPSGNLSSLTYSDGSLVLYSYDGLDRLVRLEDWFDPGSPPEAPENLPGCESVEVCRLTTYVYDSVGNLSSLMLPDGSAVSYGYDLANRPTHIANSNPTAGTIFEGHFAYDAAGQSVSAQLTLPLDPQIDEAFHDLVYNELNQVILRNGDSFGYDEDGNMTSGVIEGAPASLVYDEFNQLTRIDGNTFHYDVDGLRVRTTRDGLTRRYIYDSVASVPRLLEEHDADGNLVTRYVHGLGLVSREAAGAQEFRVYHYDRRGSTVALTDAAGTITDAYAYDAHGKSAGTSGATPNPFRFNGRDGVQDDGNGLYYAGVRYYSPELMRFIQQDVAPAGLTESGLLNRYAYANGNPIQFVDPDGNWFGLDDAFAAIGGALVSVIFQGVECLVSGEGCGWEDFLGAAAAGAVYGETLLYTANPYAAGAAGGFADAVFTNALKAIPGGQDTSWESALMEIGVGTAVGGASGIFGGKGLGGMNVVKDVSKNLGREGVKRLFKGPAMRAAFNQGLRKVLGKKIVTKALTGGAKGLWNRYGDDAMGLFSGGGGSGDPSPGSTLRGSRPPGSVWNQYSSPSADAWGNAQKQGCLEYAWR